MPDDLPVPVNPTPTPKKERERGKLHQLEAIAQMCTMGTPPGTMAAVTGLSEGYINRLLTDGRNETFNKLRESYLEKNLKTLVGARFRLADTIDQVHEALQDALNGKDMRLRTETAWKIWDQVVPKLDNGKEHATPDSIQLIINQPHVQTQINETMANVADCLVGLREAVGSQIPDKHILLGAEALPIPESQLEVSKGEAPLEPTEGPEDFLTELLEREDG